MPRIQTILGQPGALQQDHSSGTSLRMTDLVEAALRTSNGALRMRTGTESAAPSGGVEA